MELKDKRGQGILPAIFLGAIIILVLIIGLTALYHWNKSAGAIPLSDSITQSIEDVTGVIMNVLRPIFNPLLGLDKATDEDQQFLIVISFILISIIVLSTLDSVNIFGEDKKGHLINLAVGIIVSLIGVRFMPKNLWNSLTAPSSAFVATVLVGIPFVALFVLSMKIKYSWIGKAPWIIFIIILSYLIAVTTTESDAFMWVYYTFLALSIIMIFFDSKVRGWWNRERAKLKAISSVKEENTLRINELDSELKQWYKVLANSRSTPKALENARKRINHIKKAIGRLSE